MIVDLYLYYNKKRERSSLLDTFCIVHFLFGYLLYNLKFPLVFAIFIDIFLQISSRTKKGEKIIKNLLGGKDVKDDNLTYRYCDTFFIVFGWFTGYLITERIQK